MQITINILQMSWDPGELEFTVDIATTAWGQAVFQWGKDVRNLYGYRLGRPMGWASKWAIAMDFVLAHEGSHGRCSTIQIQVQVELIGL